MNSAGRGGDTPLHAAATTGNSDSTRLLLARGADPLKKNAEGETPLDVARRSSRVRCGAEGGVLGGDIVSVLEGAVEEAAAAKAAMEEEKAARFGKEEYQGERFSR